MSPDFWLYNSIVEGTFLDLGRATASFDQAPPSPAPTTWPQSPLPMMFSQSPEIDSHSNFLNGTEPRDLNFHSH